MKKKVITFMISCLCIGCLCACGQAEQEGNSDVTQVTEQSKETDETLGKESTDADTSKEAQTPEFKIPEDFCGLTLDEAGELGYYTDGEIDKTYAGLAEYEGEWYYIEEGAVDEAYTGTAYRESEFWYVVDGKVDTTYLGTIEYNGKMFSVVDGKVDTTYTRESGELSVVDVAGEETEQVWNYLRNVSDLNAAEEVTTYEVDIVYPKDGLYRMLIKNCGDGANYAFYDYQHYLLDAFRESAGLNASGKSRSSEGDNYHLWSIGGCKAQSKDILVTECWTRTTVSWLGSIEYELYFMNSTVELSGETTVNDSFNEKEAFTGMDNLSDGSIAAVTQYKYTPTESGKYVISVDDIEISKPLDVYSKNNLFDIVAYDEEGKKVSEIYVHGEDAYVIVDYKEGETYTIYTCVYKYNNSEKYRNGDVRFSINIKKAKEQTDITGYTQINDSIDYENECVVYSIVPTKKQDINFTLSSGEGAFKVEIKDESDNIIYEYPELKEGDSFAIKDTLSDYEYRVCVSSETICDYVLDVQY